MSLVLNVEILGEFKKLTAATQGAQTDLQRMSGAATKISSGINKAFAAIGIGLSFRVIANELEEATKAAIEDRKSQELLANQLINTTGATKSQIAAVEKSISALQIQASIADDELRPAMAQLTRATGSTTEATKLLTLATNISAATGKDLNSVSVGLSKAFNGQFAALSKLGIPMSDSIANAALYSKEMKTMTKLQSDASAALDTFGIKSKEYQKAQEKVTEQQDKLNRINEAGIDWQKQLGDAFAGSAEKAANTDPYQRMQIIFGEIQEQLGTALLPVLDDFATWMSSPPGQKTLQEIADAATNVLTELKKTAQWAIANKDWLVPLAGAVGIFSATVKGIGLITTAINGAKAAQELFNAAAYRNPWIIALGAVAGIAAIGAAINSEPVAKESNTYLKNLNANIPSAGAIGIGGAPTVKNEVTINLTQPNAKASDIIKGLEDYYKATGTRLSVDR